MLTFLPEWRGLPPELVLPYSPRRNIQDDDNPPRLRGDQTGLPMPPRHQLPHDEVFTLEVDESVEQFNVWMQSEDIWTLAYSKAAFEAVFEIEVHFPLVWLELKREIYPSQKNTLAHRPHGKYSVYTSGGCRGPLCKMGNREYHRAMGEFDPNDESVQLEEYLRPIRDSFWHYLKYIKYVKAWRSVNDGRKRDDPLRWSKVTLRDTLLMDVTSV